MKKEMMSENEINIEDKPITPEQIEILRHVLLEPLPDDLAELKDYDE